MTSCEPGAPGDTGDQVPYVSPVPRRRVLLRNSRWTVVSKETTYEGLIGKMADVGGQAEGTRRSL